MRLEMLPLIVLLVLTASSCATVGDGKILGHEPTTGTGRALVKAGAFLKENPQYIEYAKIAARVACAKYGCTAIADVAVAVSALADDVKAGAAVTQAEQDAYDALGKLDDALRSAVVTDVAVEEIR